MVERPQQMLHAVLDRVKREAEKRAEQCAREVVVDPHHFDQEVHDICFDYCIAEEQQRRRRAINEGLADDEGWAHRARIEHRGGNADDLSEAIRAWRIS